MSDNRVPIWKREPAAIAALAGAVITLVVSAGFDLSAEAQAAVLTIVWLVAGGAVRHEVSPVRRDIGQS